MLERIREGSQGFWAKAILGLVILTFALAGVGSYLNAKSDQPVATVNGDDIPQSSLERAYQNERARMEAQYGDAFANLMADSEYMKTFRRGLLDRLIADKLLEQTAREMGLGVSDEQLKQAIISMPEFQIAGTFNNDRYQAILRQAGFQPKDFRDMMRTDMTRQQVVRAMLGSEFSLEGEVQQAYQLQQQSRDISHVLIPAAKFVDSVEVTDDEINQYYQANISQFDTQEKVALRYVELKLEDLMSAIDATEEELEAHYQANLDQYRTEEERRASHILLETGEDEGAARQKAEDILARIEAGEDFAELASEVSDDTFSAESGGDLDWFGRGVMDPAFEEAVFNLSEEGDLSGIVQSDFGLHIIKLTGIRPEQTQTLEQVREEILTQVKRDKAQAEFYRLHQQIAEVAFEMPDNLDEVATIAGNPVQSTELFSRDQAPELFAGNMMLNAAFSEELIEDRVNSEVMDVEDDHLVVFRVAEHEPQRTRSLDEVRTDIIATLKDNKAQQQAYEWAGQLVAQLRDGQSVDSTLEEKSLRWTPVEGVRRFGAMLPPALVEQAFKLPATEGENVAAVNTADGNVGLVRVETIHDAPQAEESLLASLEQRLTSNRGQQLYTNFVEALKAKADIEIYAAQPE
ncbi:SurA N-terminal domain-containing protein [Bowmanella dokdonensis]|uniref:Periplasmic chaperone PpiD n=1 Tax=Bowmanella dokdonensis TaxID=751969 RepID=A0A939IQX3_9ALTE|nr:SurA N-terminal domain-containing protein [Bowmanella dokdonensis]MBN7824881.1 SurA N-terminal domain-containing protein [Bowmanella dokdonensis]